MAISVLSKHAEMQVPSENELDMWIIHYERKKEMLNSEAQWLFGESLGMEDPPPQGQPIAQYRSLNPKHNDYLNEIYYHIERLRKQLPQAQ